MTAILVQQLNIASWLVILFNSILSCLRSSALSSANLFILSLPAGNSSLHVGQFKSISLDIHTAHIKWYWEQPKMGSEASSQHTGHCRSFFLRAIVFRRNWTWLLLGVMPPMLFTAFWCNFKSFSCCFFNFEINWFFLSSVLIICFLFCFSFDEVLLRNYILFFFFSCQKCIEDLYQIWKVTPLFGI